MALTSVGEAFLHDHITSQLVARGVTVTAQQYVSSLDRMLPLVLAGSAIAITTPSPATARPVEGVVYRYFTDPRPYIDCSLVWRRDTAGAAVLDLVAAVRELRDGGAFLPPEL